MLAKMTKKRGPYRKGRHITDDPDRPLVGDAGTTGAVRVDKRRIMALVHAVQAAWVGDAPAEYAEFVQQAAETGETADATTSSAAAEVDEESAGGGEVVREGRLETDVNPEGSEDA